MTSVQLGNLNAKIGRSATVHARPRYFKPQLLHLRPDLCELTHPEHRHTLEVTSSYTFKNMSSNVGLSTPRGSGTSGYVQRNLSQLRPRDNVAPYPKDYDSIKHRQRQPDKDILNHDRLREIEVKVFDLRDKLEDEGYVCSDLLLRWVLLGELADAHCAQCR